VDASDRRAAQIRSSNLVPIVYYHQECPVHRAYTLTTEYIFIVFDDAFSGKLAQRTQSGGTPLISLMRKNGARKAQSKREQNFLAAGSPKIKRHFAQVGVVRFISRPVICFPFKKFERPPS
jgi:hypothetical protein